MGMMEPQYKIQATLNPTVSGVRALRNLVFLTSAAVIHIFGAVFKAGRGGCVGG